MIEILQSLAAAAELGLLAAGAMHLKVKGSSVLVHMLGSHRKGLDDPKANRIAAEGVGILTLNIDSEAYRAEHGLHHGLRSFARPHADPDATLIHDLGFRPGVPLPRLRRLASTSGLARPACAACSPPARGCALRRPGDSGARC